MDAARLFPDFMGLSGWGKALFYRPRIVPTPFLPAKLSALCHQFVTRLNRETKQEEKPGKATKSNYGAEGGICINVLKILHNYRTNDQPISPLEPFKYLLEEFRRPGPLSPHFSA